VLLGFGRSCQELLGVGTSRGHKYVGVAMIRHGLSGFSGELSGVFRSCQEVSGGVRSYQKFSGVLRSDQSLSGFARHFTELNLSGRTRSGQELSVCNRQELLVPVVCMFVVDS
jgi:hypothetical protein